jgi:uncharacterized protein YndB with AHSA1/START domain
MPVTDITPDIDARTLTIVADFAAPVERVWQVYADPVSWRRCGARRPTRPRWSTTTCGPAAARPTT